MFLAILYHILNYVTRYFISVRTSQHLCMLYISFPPFYNRVFHISAICMLLSFFYTQHTPKMHRYPFTIPNKYESRKPSIIHNRNIMLSVGIPPFKIGFLFFLQHGNEIQYLLRHPACRLLSFGFRHSISILIHTAALYPASLQFFPDSFLNHLLQIFTVLLMQNCTY